jgi:hypothetical protein
VGAPSADTFDFPKSPPCKKGLEFTVLYARFKVGRGSPFSGHFQLSPSRPLVKRGLNLPYCTRGLRLGVGAPSADCSDPPKLPPCKKGLDFFKEVSENRVS